VELDEKRIDPELDLETDEEKVVVEDEVRALEEEQAPVLDEEHAKDVSGLSFYEIVDYIEQLLAGNDREFDHVAQMETREARALELLRMAITGRRPHTFGMVYAEDRQVFLNQALAVLQPILALGFEAELVEGTDVYAHLVEELGDFKASLLSLENAQEEFFESDRQFAAEQPKPKPKPKPDAGEAGGDVPRPSTLSGPGAAVEKPVAPSTLSGPGPAVDKPVTPSTLSGPGPAVEQKPQPSTVYDGDERRR